MSGDRKVRRVGIMTTGGETSTMNYLVSILTKELTSHCVEVYGFKEAWKGLCRADGTGWIKLDSEIVQKYENIPGSEYLRCCRGFNSFSFRGKDYSNIAVKNYIELGLDLIFVLGGDGSYAHALDYVQKTSQTMNKMRFFGLPCTMDGMVGTNASLGMYTAIQAAADEICASQRSGRSLNRLPIIETMGRNLGYIAALSALEAISRGVEVAAVLLPEIPFEIMELANHVEKYDCAAVVVSEGIQGSAFRTQDSYITSIAGYHRRLDGAAKMLADILTNICQYRECYERDEFYSFDVKATSAGYLQRSGITSIRDKCNAKRFAEFALSRVLEGYYNEAVVEQEHGTLETMTLTELVALNRKDSFEDKKILLKALKELINYNVYIGKFKVEL